MRTIGTIRLGFLEDATGANTISQILQGINSHLPVDAGVSDTDTLKQVGGSLWGNLLVTLVDVGLDHNTDDTRLTLAQLVRDLLSNKGLVEVVLLGVSVGAVDHDNLTLLLGAQGLTGTADALAIVVGALSATAQDNEAVLVTSGLGNGSQTLLGHTEEAVRVSSGADGVNGDGETTVGSILETNGEGQTGGQLTVQLGLGGAGTDGTEGDQIGQVLWGDGVQHLASDGETGAGQVNVELARNAQTLVDLVGLVHVRVVDETLPADGGTGLFEVGAHDNQEVLGQFVGELLQAAGVLESSVRVVDGAGSDNDQETVVALFNDLDGFIATSADGLHATVGL